MGEAPKRAESELSVGDNKFAIVAGRFNESFVSRMVKGALEAITHHGGKTEDVPVLWVPGAFELPMTAKKLGDTGNYDAIICLGAVIRGDTPHFDFVAGEAARGIGQAAMLTGVPCVFGVITTDTVEQAEARCGDGKDNKGYEAAMAAIEMGNLFRTL